MGYQRKGWRSLIKLLLGFIAGVLYGAIYTAESPDGMMAKAAAMIKLIFF